ncbi:uncharacterized protein [Rutidosis leptorrhynchoides]|uniref:uncharacterized protein n=1 Tax=Rutidosis leptorrhynchoides TaxID=125765 RepID=UPI003A99C163
MWKGKADVALKNVEEGVMSSGQVCNILNVYGPHDDAKKLKLWDDLSKLVSGIEESWILCGDFNEAGNEAERFNCDFIEYRVKWFNEFIANNSLIDFPLGGCNFTRVSDDGLKYSKLDRFLASKKFQHLWNDLSAVVLDRHLSDHCPIVLKEVERNFDPKPFKIFNAWLDEDDVDNVIRNAWNLPVPDIY